MTNEQILKSLQEMLDEEQINLNAEDLYDASADRYKKYAKAKNKIVKSIFIFAKAFLGLFVILR